MSRNSRVGSHSPWITVEGRVVRESPSGKAVLFEFAEVAVFGGEHDGETVRYSTWYRNPHWIPKKCFKIEDGRPWIVYWFHKKLVEEWETGTPPPKRTTKKELCEKAMRMRRIEADESFLKTEPKTEPEPKFFGNVNKVLEKILN